MNCMINCLSLFYLFRWHLVGAALTVIGFASERKIVSGKDKGNFIIMNALGYKCDGMCEYKCKYGYGFEADKLCLNSM